MHLSTPSLLLLTASTFAAPISNLDEGALTKRGGPNFGGDCWVLRNPDGTTNYSNRYLGPKSHYRVGCRKGEQEVRRKEAAEKKKRLEDEIKTMELNEEQMACFARPSTADLDVADSSQTPLGGETVVPADAEQVIEDRVRLVELHGSVNDCNKCRAQDKRAGWGVGFGTKRACKGDTGRLADVDICLKQVGGYPGPYI